MAGLLHDVGKLILVDAFPDKYTSVMRMAETEGVSCWEAEQNVFGTSHAEIGTYLLWLWGLPDSVVEAVAYHHAPSRCPAQQRGPLAAVHMANVLSRMHSQGGETDRPEIDRAYIERLGLPVDLAAWQVLAGEALQEQETK
jgi:HD-like signal output (HDOD) protein